MEKAPVVLAIATDGCSPSVIEDQSSRYLFHLQVARTAESRCTMPSVKLSKRSIDALPTPDKDIVYWDRNCPGFGVKVTPKAVRFS
jgi:hypothetical protein